MVTAPSSDCEEMVPTIRADRERRAHGRGSGWQARAWERALRAMLVAGGLYLLGESALHASGLRLSSVYGAWPPAAVRYARLIEVIYASFALCVALLAFELQRSPVHYRRLLHLAGAWAGLHGLLLAGLALDPGLLPPPGALPSLRVWIPWYAEYLVFEAALLWSFGLLVVLWSRSSQEG